MCDRIPFLSVPGSTMSYYCTGSVGFPLATVAPEELLDRVCPYVLTLAGCGWWSGGGRGRGILTALTMATSFGQNPTWGLPSPGLLGFQWAVSENLLTGTTARSKHISRPGIGTGIALSAFPLRQIHSQAFNPSKLPADYQHDQKQLVPRPLLPQTAHVTTTPCRPPHNAVIWFRSMNMANLFEFK